MSLINQMLRDLEQRNRQKPRAAEPLKVRTTSRASGRLIRWLWLLSLTSLPVAYFWLQNRPEPIAQHQNPTTSPVTVSQTRPTQSAAPEPAPQIAALPQPLSQVQSQTPLAAEAPAQLTKQIAATALPETAIPAKQPETISKAAKPLEKPAGKPSEKASEASAAAQVKTATPQEQAENLYRLAQRSSSLTTTRATLQAALQLEPRHLPARTLLLQTLLKLPATDLELSSFADNSLQFFPDNMLFIKTRAHLYVQQKNFSSALKLLERIDAKNGQDIAYLALLAACYQQLQRFPEALRVYQSLTEIQPGKAENWLGLAIAQDKLDRRQEASQAYRQALDKKTLNGEVVDYINQRLSALN